MHIVYTADVIDQDGSDTNCYGEPCEAGHGYTLTSGWVASYEVGSGDPTVYTELGDGPVQSWKADVWSPLEGPMIDWAVSTILARIGTPEDVSGSTVYASGQCEDYATGSTARYAAHLYGAAPAIEAAIGYAIARCARYPYPGHN